MSFEDARMHLSKCGVEKRIMEFDVSSATVEQAAQALHCAAERIAKTLSFKVGEKAILIVAAGNYKIDNAKYKAFFKTKAKMLTSEEVTSLIGHQVGGVCPFGVKSGIKIYLDESLKQFATVFPACGSRNSAIELTPTELEAFISDCQWIDVCKKIQDVG